MNMQILLICIKDSYTHTYIYNHIVNLHISNSTKILDVGPYCIIDQDNNPQVELLIKVFH